MPTQTLLLVTALCCLTSNLFSQPFSETDKTALLAIDAACDGSNTLNWNTEADPGLWEGISWNGDNPRRVSNLYIPNKSLTNNLDASALSALEQIYCINNQLTGLIVNNLTNLTTIRCWENQLTSLNVADLTSLAFIECSSNQLTNLNLTNLTNLSELYCSNNNLTNLNVSNLANLTSLDCGRNQITSLEVSDLDKLELLICSTNPVTQLDIENLTNLKRLTCNSNGLTTLNVADLTNLTILECNENKLTSLDVDNLVNLSTLSCSDNLLTSLNVNNLVNLNRLICCRNQLTSLNVANLTLLQELVCFENQLTSLAVDNLTHLTSLMCYSNDLTSLNVENLTDLTRLCCDDNHITSLKVDNLTKLTMLYCEMNELTSLNVRNLVALTTLGCRFNLLTELEVNNLTNLESLYCSSNKLSSLNTTNLVNLTELYCEHNKLPFSVLANGLQAGTFIYNPQDTLYEKQILTGNLTIDYSMEANIDGTLTEFAFYKNGAVTETNSTGYYLTQGIGEYYCTMTNGLFPGTSLTTAKITISNPEGYDEGDIAALLAIDAECDIFDSLNWNTEPDPGNWEGVTWNTSDTGRVIRLLLLNKPLTGHLDATPLKELTDFYYKITQLNSLDFSNLLHLTSIGCKISNVTSINLTNLPELTYLNCNDNQLEDLDLSDLTNLAEISCDTNQLTNLDFTGLTNLASISCYMNKITHLDLSNLPELSFVICSINKIPFSSLATGLHIPIYMYNPQDTLYEEDTIIGNTTLDYSTEALINGTPTQFVFYKNDAEIETNSTGLLTTNGNGEYHCTMTNSLFPGLTLATSAITITGVTGLEDNNESIFTIYPNPVSNHLFVSSTKGIEQVSVYSLTGVELIKTSNFSTGIDLSGLLSGTYVVKITGYGKQDIQKIAVK
jgi:Leucine-rich repeat (LRR) protein